MSVLTKNGVLDLAEKGGLRRVLMVTALPLEMKAVRAHLTQLGSVVGRAGCIYECGQFSASGAEWLVVVAESGAGTHAAQAVVTSSRMDFENFEMVIFVGIAGSRKPEAPVGCVVIGNHIYYPYVGKHVAGAGFLYRSREIKVQSRLVGIANKVERDADWQTRIRDPLKTALPPIEERPKPFPPNAIVAPIASIESVSADPDSELEAVISLHCQDALAVEMESYGAALAAHDEEMPFIVVRGISDMRGGKAPEKDAIHQPIAASHAAAFAFEFLNLWSQFYSAPQVGSASLASGETGVAFGQPDLPKTPSPRPVEESPLGLKKTIVVNLDGSVSSLPPAKLESVLKALQKVSGDPTLRIVGTEEGSIRLIIEGSAEALDRLSSTDGLNAIKKDVSAKILGILDVAEYRRAQLVEQALKNASKDLLDWPSTLPDGTQIERPELNQLLSIIETTESSTTAVLGVAGSGKSALLASLGKELAARNIPLLAIKADLLDATLQTESDLARDLLLPGEASRLLIELCLLRPVVLLIDQLDALAGYVDLRTGRLSVLLNIVRRLGNRRNIHIVLSARTFEFEHDARLKAIRSESLMLSLPPWSTVLQVLEAAGVNAAGWPSGARELMREPQALATFLKLNPRADKPPFDTYQAMLDQLWNERILSQPNGPRISKLASDIAESMAETESLWLPAARFENQTAELDILIANQILTDYDGTKGRIGFSHQTVFDHALARSFARGGARLSEYILERQSSLFVRPKLWVALNYLRGVDRATYHSEFSALWSRQDLRPHLRHMLVEFLGQQTSPTATEITAFEEALNSQERQVALQSLVGSAGWFSLFFSSHISDAMTCDKEAGATIGILDKAWSFAFEKVVALIRKNWLPISKFDWQFWNVLLACPSWTEEVAKLATALVRRTEIGRYAVDQMVATVGVDHPDIALRLVATKLLRELELASIAARDLAAQKPPEGETKQQVWLMAQSPCKPIVETLEGQGWDSLEAIAGEHGQLFIRHMWPVFVEAMSMIRNVRGEVGDGGFSIPYALDFRFSGENSLDLPDPPLLGAFAVAIESFATRSQAEFLAWLKEHEFEDARPAQRLFAHALASAPELYAERSAEFLLGDKRRLFLGNIEDMSGTTKRLVAAASSHWSSETREHFVKEVMAFSLPMDHSDPPKNRRARQRIVRVTKFGILNAIPYELQTPELARYLQQERRRFPDDKVGATFTGPAWIGSPMSAQSMAKASDADILNAFKEIPDGSDWDHPTRWMKGGNIQLSREFAEFAKADNDRAAAIIRKFQPVFGARGAGYALDAMAEAAEPSFILGLVCELHGRGFSSEEFRDSSARAVERLIRRDAHIPDEVLSLLESWLKEHQEPLRNSDGEGSLEDVGDDSAKKEKEEGGSILWGHGGISVLPHGNYPILEALTRALLARQESDRVLTLYEAHLTRKESDTVWQALLRFVRYIHPSDPERLAAFLKSLFAKYPELLPTRDAIVMFAYLHWRYAETIRELIANWKFSDVRDLRQAYGEVVTLIALTQPQLAWSGQALNELLEQRDCAVRLGATHAAVHLWAEAEDKFAVPASAVLRAVLPEADRRIWSAFSELFRHLDEIAPTPEWIGLLSVVADHLQHASGLDSSFIVDRLQTLLPHQAPLVARLASGLVASWGSELGDMRTGTAMVAKDLVDLAITLHRLGPQSREAGTQLFEDLLRVNAYTARDTLNEIDNRFSSTPPPARRRLPRRQRRRVMVKRTGGSNS